MTSHSQNLTFNLTKSRKNGLKTISPIDRNRAINESFENYLMNSRIPEADHEALIAIFIELKPSTMSDAIMCREIVKTQYLVQKLQETREIYESFGIQSQKDKSQYRHILAESRMHTESLFNLLRQREGMRKNENAEI